MSTTAPLPDVGGDDYLRDMIDPVFKPLLRQIFQVCRS